jgi:hypothetical protein
MELPVTPMALMSLPTATMIFVCGGPAVFIGPLTSRVYLGALQAIPIEEKVPCIVLMDETLLSELI